MPNKRGSTTSSSSRSHTRRRASNDAGHGNNNDGNCNNNVDADDNNNDHRINNVNDEDNNVSDDNQNGVIGNNNENESDDINGNFGFLNNDYTEENEDTEYEPLDTDLVLLMNRLTEINIDQLEGDEPNKLNLNRVYVDVQLLRLITPSSQQKAMTYGARRRTNNNQDVIFSRLMLCRVHSKENYSNGCKLIYLMESKNSNQCLFNKNVELRDNGVISIGTYFRIVTPLPIENKL